LVKFSLAIGGCFTLTPSLHDHIFIRQDTIPERDRMMDGQTDGRTEMI